MKIIRRWLTPPVFENEVKSQQAFMLHVILWSLTLVPVPFLIYHILFQTADLGRTVLQTIVGETTNILLLLMLRRGYVRPASILQVSAFWLFLTVTALTGGGVQGEAYLLGYSVVIAIAGILLGLVGATLFTVLSLLSGLVLLNAQTWGLQAGPFVLDSPMSTWIVSLVMFPVGVVLQHLASRALRQALARARASEERYRLISSMTSDYTFSTELDAQGNMQLNWVAGAFEEITGYTYEDYVAAGGWRARLHPADLAQDDRDMKTLHVNQNVITEVRHYKKNGDLRWARVYGHPIWDEIQNRLIGIVGAVQDITDQKQVEETLRESESIYQKAIELTGAVPYHQIFDANGGIVYKFMGDGIRQITGYGPEEFTDDLWDTLVQERHFLEDLEPFELEEAIQQVRTGITRIWKCEHFIKTRDGRMRWIYEAAVDLRDEHGMAYGSIGFYQDVTESKLAGSREAARRALLEKVIEIGKQVTETQSLHSTLERIWHAIHDVLGFDRLAVFLYNAERNSMDSVIGTTRQGDMQDTSGIWFPIGEWTTFKRVLDKPDGVFLTDNYAVENNIPADSEMYGVKDYAAVAAWAGDKPVAVICVDNVITQRRIGPDALEALRLYAGYAGLAIENARLNASLQAELANRQNFIGELEAKNAELERFTYTVSHDLKSPLVTIVGFLGYVEKDALAGDTERVRSGIERITSAAKKMERLLNDLLELSRIGRLMNPPENVPFSEIVREALERVRGRLDANHVQIIIHEPLPIVHGDRVRLVEIMQNLLDNAAKFTAGAATPCIEIGTKGSDENQHHILFVCDNGIGIEPEFHERIFGLFNKLNPTAEGTGIGLTLVKRIIEVHGGHIWVESTPGKGATFYFSLPASTH